MYFLNSHVLEPSHIAEAKSEDMERMTWGDDVLGLSSCFRAKLDLLQKISMIFLSSCHMLVYTFLVLQLSCCVLSVISDILVAKAEPSGS